MVWWAWHGLSGDCLVRRRGGQSRMEQVSFIGLVWALPYLLGTQREQLSLFGVSVLHGQYRLPRFSRSIYVSFRLSRTGLLNGVGLAVERSGTALYLSARCRVQWRWQIRVAVSARCSR